MSNTIAAAINEIATIASLTTNTTYASSSVAINWSQASQTARINMLKEFIQYGDHLAYVHPDTGVLWLIDTLTGITPAIDGATSADFSNYAIKSIKAETQGKTIGKIVADLTIKELSRPSNGRPSLKDIPIRLSLATDYPSQDEYKINVKSKPTLLSGSDIIYSYTDINTVLARKKSMYQSKMITIEYAGFFELQWGQRLTFDNTHDNDVIKSLTGSGSMTVLDPGYDPAKMTMTIKGIGSFSES